MGEPDEGPATRYDVDAGVATITLARPGNANALSAELVDSLGDNLERAIGDENVRVVVLTHDGRTFCAGADLKSRAKGAPGSGPRHDLVGVLTTILDSPKPVVGRIAGHCMGGGVGLAAACDISVVADTAKFGFTEVRIGVAPAIISVVCLPKLRRADALELFLTGERIEAARAAEVGLVNQVVPAGAIDTAVGEVVAKLRAGGPNALAAAKQLVARVPELSRADAFAWTAELSATLFRSEEAAAGMAAFRDRTAPPWAT
ncbi:MAG TPA: enoyl-CoA hydratase-related protein [Acidimicrobiales bacterium]